MRSAQRLQIFKVSPLPATLRISNTIPPPGNTHSVSWNLFPDCRLLSMTCSMMYRASDIDSVGTSAKSPSLSSVPTSSSAVAFVGRSRTGITVARGLGLFSAMMRGFAGEFYRGCDNARGRRDSAQSSIARELLDALMPSRAAGESGNTVELSFSVQELVCVFG